MSLLIGYAETSQQDRCRTRFGPSVRRVALLSAAQYGRIPDARTRRKAGATGGGTERFCAVVMQL